MGVLNCNIGVLADAMISAEEKTITHYLQDMSWLPIEM